MCHRSRSQMVNLDVLRKFLTKRVCMSEMDTVPYTDLKLFAMFMLEDRCTDNRQMDRP